MISVVAVVVAAIFPPCNLPFTIRAESDVPVEVRAAAILAAATWNKELGRDVFSWRVTSHADITVQAKNGKKYLGYWDALEVEGCTIGGVIEWYDGYDQCPQRLLRIMLHEMGHALGLSHEDEKYGKVMGHFTPNCNKEIDVEISPELVKRALEVIQ